MRIALAFVLCLITIISLGFYMVGMHGRLMFRSHMREDWIIWGIAVSSFSIAIVLMIYELRGRNKIIK
jgi:hypothetical protein